MSEDRNETPKRDWDLDSTNQSQGIWNTVNSIVDKMSLSYFCKKINDLLKGTTSMEEDKVGPCVQLRCSFFRCYLYGSSDLF